MTYFWLQQPAKAGHEWISIRKPLHINKDIPRYLTYPTPTQSQKFLLARHPILIIYQHQLQQIQCAAKPSSICFHQFDKEGTKKKKKNNPMAATGHVEESKKFAPKDPPKLNPPRDDPISIDELAKCDGTIRLLYTASAEMAPNFG